MSLAEICIRRPVFTWMLTLLPVVLGLACYTTLKTDLFPNVDLPIVAVTTLLPGASAEEVETQITKLIEEQINTVGGIEEIRSTSQEGVSVITVEFKMSKNRDTAAQEIRDKVSRLTSQFPVGTETPIIEKFELEASPILTLAVSGDRSLPEVTELAKKVVKEDIETLQGVGAVNLLGGRQRAINVIVDPVKLRKFGMSVEQLRRAITEQNVELPGGRVDQQQRELVLRTLGRVRAPAELLELVIDSPNGAPIRVRDVATVEDSFEEPRSLGRLRLLEAGNHGSAEAAPAERSAAGGRNAVILAVLKQSGTNSVELADRVKTRLETVRRLLPTDVRVEVVRDQTKFTKASIEEVKFHLLLGGVLVSLTVLLFMKDIRTMLLASASIPVSIIGTFVVMWYFDFSLDNITMIGLVLAVGIVIDDAVVVHENIFRFIEEKGLSPMEAAAEGAKEIALAVVATTLSLVVIFLPLGFMGGRIGPFFKGFGIVIASAVLLSLWISFTMTPMFCSRFLRASRGPRVGQGGVIYRLFDRFYGWVLRWSLQHRWVVVVLSLGVLYATGPLAAMIGKDFIPKDDQSEFEVAFTTPEGWTLEQTDKVAREIEAELAANTRGVRQIVTTLGESGNNLSRAQGDVTLGSIVVAITELEHRTLSLPRAGWDMVCCAAGQPALLLSPGRLWAAARARQTHVFSQFGEMAAARERLTARFPDLRMSIRDVSPFSGVGVRAGDLELNIRGPDMAKLEQYADELMRQMRTIPGLYDVDSTLALRKPELRVYVDREKAADQRVPVQAVAATLNTLVGGQVVGEYVEGAERYDVWLRARPDSRDDPAEIGQLTVPNREGRLVELREVARLEETPGPAQIDRYLRQRKVTIVASLVGLPTQDAVAAVSAKVPGLNLPPDYVLDFTGRAKTSSESNSGFLVAFVLGFVLMYMILAAQFESFVHPITILLSIPLTIPFALASLLLLGQPLDIYSMFGMFMLFGIVKKNGILQVDYANVLRKRGLPRDEAILESNHTRLRPILMTTFMLVAGMIPVALGQGPGAGARASMAKVIVGGQALSLLLTLLVVPVAYSLFDDAGERIDQVRRRVFDWLERHIVGVALPATPDDTIPPHVSAGPSASSIADTVESRTKS